MAPMALMEPRRYITVQTASKAYGLGISTLRKFVRDGRLTAYRPVPGRLLMAVGELEGLIAGSAGQRNTRGSFNPPPPDTDNMANMAAV